MPCPADEAGNTPPTAAPATRGRRPRSPPTPAPGPPGRVPARRPCGLPSPPTARTPTARPRPARRAAGRSGAAPTPARRRRSAPPAARHGAARPRDRPDHRPSPSPSPSPRRGSDGLSATPRPSRAVRRRAAPIRRPRGAAADPARACTGTCGWGNCTCTRARWCRPPCGTACSRFPGTAPRPRPKHSLRCPTTNRPHPACSPPCVKRRQEPGPGPAPPSSAPPEQRRPRVLPRQSAAWERR